MATKTKKKNDLRGGLTDITTIRNERIRAKNIEEHDSIKIRRAQVSSKDRNNVSVTIGSAVMEQAGLVAGDRVRVYLSEESENILGIGIPKNTKNGWKLCPYNHKSMGYENYDDAIGEVCDVTFHFVEHEIDKLPKIPVDSTIELQMRDMDINPESNIRIVLNLDKAT